jgi:hypothetical protein
MCLLAGIDPDATFRGNVISIRGNQLASTSSLLEKRDQTALAGIAGDPPPGTTWNDWGVKILFDLQDISIQHSGMNFQDCTLNLSRTGPTSYVLSVESPCGLWRIPVLSLSCAAQLDRAPAPSASSS